MFFTKNTSIFNAKNIGHKKRIYYCYLILIYETYNIEKSCLAIQMHTLLNYRLINR